MANLISSWGKVGEVPPTFVRPVAERPSDSVPISKDIPVIDLGKAKGEERPAIVQQLLKAFEEYGFFQVINHGVPESLMDEAVKVYKEFFSLPVEEKEQFAKDAANQTNRGAATLYNSSAKHYDAEELRYWRDVLEHSCTHEQNTWPSNPPRYREVIGAYSIEMKRVSKLVLGLLAEGLGLKPGFFDGELGQRMLVNHYPACPDPSSTLGIGGHCDPNLITFIQQNVYGLHILKDDKWIGVEPIPYAFVVNSGLPITVISNGKLTSVAHRVVTNKIHDRTTIGTFICPPDILEPAKELVGPCDPPRFKTFKWGADLMPHWLSKQSVYHAALEPFKADA